MRMCETALFLLPVLNRTLPLCVLLLRYGEFSKMVAIRHLGFVMHMLGPPTKGFWWCLSLCKIWFELMLQFW